MAARITVIVGLIVGSVALVAQSQPSGDAAGVDEVTPPTADLEVTLTHVSGQVESFRDELVRMDLIVDPAGRLDQVHLITKTGAEADTHIWYSVGNLVSVRYRFLAITGKGKVSVRTYTPPQVKPPADSLPHAVPAIEPEDYR
jgi:hypothetical protein